MKQLLYMPMPAFKQYLDMLSDRERIALQIIIDEIERRMELEGRRIMNDEEANLVVPDVPQSAYELLGLQTPNVLGT